MPPVAWQLCRAQWAERAAAGTRTPYCVRVPAAWKRELSVGAGAPLTAAAVRDFDGRKVNVAALLRHMETLQGALPPGSDLDAAARDFLAALLRLSDPSTLCDASLLQVCGVTSLSYNAARAAGSVPTYAELLTAWADAYDPAAAAVRLSSPAAAPEPAAAA
eukprot:gene7924-1581_t